MQKSIIKRKLKNDQPVLIPKVCFTDPSIVEMLGLLGSMESGFATITGR
ncbi:MAG: hypothetical protein QF792_06265 [Phycisphaerae bacterium]|jgi:hypothetical protein|nr:hypothetical protein [Phycisphaerae bacterium]